VASYDKATMTYVLTDDAIRAAWENYHHKMVTDGTGIYEMLEIVCFPCHQLRNAVEA
jgi:hypothetical protein